MSKYDAWLAGEIGGDSNDPRSPAYDPSRDEWIDERADELLDARLVDHDAVTEAVEQVIGFSDWTDALASDMAAVLVASDAAFEAEAARFFAQLYKRVKIDMREQAMTDAEAEAEKRDAENADMRAHYGRAA